MPRVADLAPRPYYSRVLGGEYSGRSWAYHLLGKETLALSDVTKSLEIDPKNDGSLETRAEIYAEVGQTR